MENVTIVLVEKELERPYFIVDCEKTKHLRCFVVFENTPEALAYSKAEAIEYATRLRNSTGQETRTQIEF